jgi:hypothetical protein
MTRHFIDGDKGPIPDTTEDLLAATRELRGEPEWEPYDLSYCPEYVFLIEEPSAHRQTRYPTRERCIEMAYWKAVADAAGAGDD